MEEKTILSDDPVKEVDLVAEQRALACCLVVTLCAVGMGALIWFIIHLVVKWMS